MQRSVLDGFGKMFRFKILAALYVGHGSSHFEKPNNSPLQCGVKLGWLNFPMNADGYAD